MTLENDMLICSNKLVWRRRLLLFPNVVPFFGPNDRKSVLVKTRENGHAFPELEIGRYKVASDHYLVSCYTGLIMATIDHDEHDFI